MAFDNWNRYLQETLGKLQESSQESKDNGGDGLSLKSRERRAESIRVDSKTPTKASQRRKSG